MRLFPWQSDYVTLQARRSLGAGWRGRVHNGRSGHMLIAVALVLISALAPHSTVSRAQRVNVFKTPPSRIGSHIPLVFEANRGQFGRGARYMARGSNFAALLTRTGVRLFLPATERHAVPRDPHMVLSPRSSSLNWSASGVIALTLKDMNPDVQIIPQGRLPGTANYFLGKNRSKWRTHIPTYAGVLYKNVYPSINLRFYSGRLGLEYDWIVRPGADLSRIRMRVSGAALAVSSTGSVTFHAGKTVLHQGQPRAFTQRGHYPLQSGYCVYGAHEFGFTISGHTLRRTVIIDPTLVFATYLGGGQSEGAYGITVDAQGNAIVVGDTQSPEFPLANPAQGTLQSDASCNQKFSFACSDGFVSKISADGKTLLYSTFLGGSFDDYAHGVAVDSAGNAYITGNTLSPDFPIVRGAITRYGGGGSLGDAYLTKLNPQGNSILYSSFLGGSGEDDGEGIVESGGHVYIAGSTTSGDFPTMRPWQAHIGGGTCTTATKDSTTTASCADAFVAEISDSGGTPIYSTYIGGNGDDAATAIAVSNGKAYVTGRTDSSNFPSVHPLQPAGGGTCSTDNPDVTSACDDGFLTELPPDGGTPIVSTPIGGVADDVVEDVAIGNDGSVYLAGTTQSPNFPLVHPLKGTLAQDDQDAFVMKLDPQATNLQFSTFFGGSDLDDAYGIAVDSGGNIFLTGSTLSEDFPTRDPIQAKLPSQPDVSPDDGGLQSAYVAVLSPDASQVLYGTYFGDDGQQTDNSLLPISLGADIAVDGQGDVYVAGFTMSDRLPITTSALQTEYGGGFVLKIHGAAPPPPTATPTPTSTPLPTATSRPTAASVSGGKKCKRGYKRSHGRCVKKKKHKV